MARPPVTAAVLAGHDRQVTRSFLALLAGTLGPRDQVVLVGPRHDPSTPGSWRTVGPKKLVRVSAPPALRDRVVVIDERAVPVGPWLDDLVAALDDPGIGAAAARTNIANGDELLVGVPYRPHETDVHHTLVRSLANTRAGERSTAGYLAGPTLAVHRTTVEEAGGLEALLGPSPVSTLALQAATAGGRLVVAEGSYLHHGGGPSPRPLGLSTGPRPFVSACMITKDEHDNLPRCLASIARFADEVVVYDTGSTDDTREIARAHGASVIEGFWDDDFSRARNEALRRCRGQWVLWIDADEALECQDPDASRGSLAELSSDVEGLIVLIDNLRGNKASTVMTHPACRLFRRAYGHWTGRLHEQVAARVGASRLALPLAQGMRLTHWGYLQATVGERDKGRRNIRSAFGDVTGAADLPWATRLVSLGRSHNFADDPKGGEALNRAAVASADNPGTMRLALRSLVESLLAQGRPEDALAEVARLRHASSAPMLAAMFEGRALLDLGRHEEALAAFGEVTDGLDDDGYEYSAHMVAAERAVALTALERVDEAADVLLAGLQSQGGMDVHVGMLVKCLEEAGRPLDELAHAVPAERAVAFLGQLIHLDAEMADRVLEAWHRVAPSHAVLATATSVASRLPVERLEVWSERLREVGLGTECPLVRTVSTWSRPLADRLVGAARALECFDDPRGRQAFGALAVQVEPAERDTVRDRVRQVAPSLLDIYDDLVRSAGAPRSAPIDAPGAALAGERRRVLVVDRQVADLRTLAVAAALRQVGHEVAVLHPQPVSPSQALLARLGIDVGWPAGPVDRGSWIDAAAAAVARVYADRPIDTVVLAPAAADLLPVVRRLLPTARVVLDADYNSTLPTAGMGAPDLVMSPAPGGGLTGGAPVVLLEVSAPFLYPAREPVDEPLRSGICVVGDFAAADDEALRRWAEVAADLARRAGRLPLAVVGDDPGSRFATAMPSSLAVGPLADPLPWLGTARVVLVAVERGAEHWLAAAAMCGTPALVVPADAAARAQVAPAVAALADPVQAPLWSRFAPVPGPQPGPVADDPLGSLPSPFRRPAAAGPCTHIEVDPRTASPSDLAPSGDRPLVARLHWPYGGLPAEWVGPLRDLAEEVRVDTSWARDHVVRSGLSAARVRVTRACVDTELFTPHGGPMAIHTHKTTKLLFAGDASDDSGIDALLEAYFMTFDAGDDVCLVVHLLDGGGTWGRDVRQAGAPRRERAEVVVVETSLSHEERPGLYRACDAFVWPQRAPSTIRPLAEAMACGLPVAALETGPSRELCDDRTGWMVQCSETAVAGSDLGVTPTAHGLWQLEPDLASLAQVLRDIVGDPQQRLLKGLAARDRVSTRCAGGTDRTPAHPRSGVHFARR